MENKDRCPRCGALVLPQERFCSNCGAALAQGGEGVAFAVDEAEGAEAAYVADGRDMSALDAVPETIEELRRYCESRGMPLEKMRFFVGVNERSPRAFGIYQEGDRFVVYKNKADGSRAVRYNGPDEAFAVKELFDKLLDECHQRNIWPDANPEDVRARKRRENRIFAVVTALVVALVIAIAVFAIREDKRVHAHDGYYRGGGSRVYYRYGSDWYYDDPLDSYGWLEIATYPYDDYEDYYISADYDDGYGVEDFRQSETWESIQERSHSSSDSSSYDSWDSGDTDWSSDW